MKFSLAVVALAEVAALTEAAPNGKNKGKPPKFQLKQVENPNYRQVDGPTALATVYAKYHIPTPPQLQTAMDKNPMLKDMFKSKIAGGGVTGTVKNYPAPNFDTHYVVPMQIGTPPQTINMNFDTGSADLWVFSNDTEPSQVMGQTLYRPDKSSSANRLTGASWSITYGDGAQAQGIVYTDRVSLGATYFDKQAVQAATRVSQDISRDNFASGILGMGKPSGNQVRPRKQQPYSNNIKSSLASPIFTANLNPQAPGTYNFGYIDNNEKKGDVKYFPSDPNSAYWEISIDGYSIKNTSKTFPYRWKAIVDTGTTLMVLPQNMVNDFYRGVKGAGFDYSWGAIVYPCSSTLPNFYVRQDSYVGKVSGKLLKYGAINSTHCYGGIQSSGNFGMGILGDMFLKSQFAVFDMGQNAVGLANKPGI